MSEGQNVIGAATKFWSLGTTTFSLRDVNPAYWYSPSFYPDTDSIEQSTWNPCHIKKLCLCSLSPPLKHHITFCWMPPLLKSLTGRSALPPPHQLMHLSTHANLALFAITLLLSAPFGGHSQSEAKFLYARATSLKGPVIVLILADTPLKEKLFIPYSSHGPCWRGKCLLWTPWISPNSDFLSQVLGSPDYPPYDTPMQVTKLPWFGALMNVFPLPELFTSAAQCFMNWWLRVPFPILFTFLSQLSFLLPQPPSVPGPCHYSDNLSSTLFSFLTCRGAVPWDIEQWGLERRLTTWAMDWLSGRFSFHPDRCDGTSRLETRIGANYIQIVVGSM